MAKKNDDPTLLRRHQKVVAAVDLPRVPAGTKGKVMMVNGFTWVRYWVRFGDIQLGQLDRSTLERVEDWDFRRNEPKPVLAAV